MTARACAFDDHVATAACRTKLRVACKLVDDYAHIALPDRLPWKIAARNATVAAASSAPSLRLTDSAAPLLLTDAPRAAAATTSSTPAAPSASSAASLSASSAVDEVVAAVSGRSRITGISADSADALQRTEAIAARAAASSRAITARRTPAPVPEPRWHAPWRLSRVISAHTGWVRSCAVDPSNDWFVTGAADRTIKVWDLASGALKLTLTGHINTVRALAVSRAHPYLFSAGEDKLVKCWDLEANRVIRSYHGHNAGVYALALHPSLDLCVTGGRDKALRVWDIRTREAVQTLAGHENAVASILTSGTEPQIISGSMDDTIRVRDTPAWTVADARCMRWAVQCWDIVAGRVRTVLTHHKKAVRALVAHGRENAFVSGAADHLKKWALPDGIFVHNLDGHNSIVNTLALNADDVLVSGGDDGSIKLWDYATGYSFQEIQTKVQPGSLDAEAGIFALAFDMSGSRLISCEADKSIKIYKEDTEATPETHPIDMAGWSEYFRSHKRF